MTISYPVTGDGRHCDVAAALVKGYLHVLQRPDREPAPLPATWTQDELDAADRLAERMGLIEGLPAECQYEEEDIDGW